MYENKVWTLIDLLDDRWVIKNKWIFKRKTDPDSSVTIYKARIVAKCFWKVQGVDYDEIFSLVSMLKVCPNHVSNCHILWNLANGCQNCMELLKKSCIWCNQKVLSILKVLTKCASSSDPSTNWCKHLGVGIYALISWSKHIVLYRLAVKPVFTRKGVGASK